MNTGFMGSDVFGNRIGQPTRMMAGLGHLAPRRQGKVHLGQSRTSGVEYDPSSSSLCALLKKAIAANVKSAAGPEWDTFFSAVGRLRPLEKENGKWWAEIYHQMALECPDEVSHLRSMHGVQVPSDKCVKLTIQKSENQIISTITEPYQIRGWTIVRVRVASSTMVPKPAAQGAMEEKSSPKMVPYVYEIWACPPGESVPEKTSLNAQEAADLARSLGEAVGPLRAATLEAAACVKDSQADLLVTERLLDRLGSAASTEGGAVDVTQDEVNAAKKIIDCASQLGAKVTPPPAVVAAEGGLSTLTTVGLIGGAGALTALLVL
jgi:hypothetical protein